MDYVKNKFWNLIDIFEEYPKVFWLSFFYMVLAGLAMYGFFPILYKIAYLEFFGQTPFYNLISDNYNILKWGSLAVPTLILLWGWIDAEDLYFRLQNRKYRY